MSCHTKMYLKMTKKFSEAKISVYYVGKAVVSGWRTIGGRKDYWGRILDGKILIQYITIVVSTINTPTRFLDYI